MQPSDLAEAINECVEYFHDKNIRNGWINGNDEDNRFAVPARLMLIVSELAEAMEGDRKNLMDDKLTHHPMMKVELCDALIRIFNLAGIKDYTDLGNVMMEKAAYNDVRADHKPEARAGVHGKKY